MANKKTITPEKLLKEKAENLAVYQVVAALVLMCGSITALRSLRSFYATVRGMAVLDPLTLWIAGIGVAVFLISFILFLTQKNKVVRLILPFCLMISALTAVTGISMNLFWTQGFSSLYFLCCAMFIQYIVLHLYHWEFFLFSLSTVSAGFACFTFSNGMGWNLWNTVVMGLAALILVGIVVITKRSSKTGILHMGRREIKLFSSKSNPSLLYLVSGLWLACLAAAVVLGSLFAYYCMFAAIAVEFIAAVYYTFQLN